MNSKQRSFDPSYGEGAYWKATGNVNRFFLRRIYCRRRDHDIFAQLVSCLRTARKSFGKILLPWRSRPFLKFSSTGDSAEPNYMRFLLPFGREVLCVVFQKAARGIFWDFRHLKGL